MEWIKMKDEATLPQPGCLAYWDDGRMTVLDDQNDCEYAVYTTTPAKLTHWMPLPDPPEEI